MAALREAPFAIVSSEFSVLWSSCFSKICLTMDCTIGVRVASPTNSTNWILSGDKSAKTHQKIS